MDGLMQRWHVAYTRVRREASARIDLLDRGYEVLFLHYLGAVTHARRTRQVLKPLYPRYLFVGVSPGQSLYGAAEVPSVAAVLRNGDQPLEVPSAVIEELRGRCGPSGLIAAPRARERRRWGRGERVRIAEGPLMGFMATVAQDGGHAVRVWVEALGGKVVATMDASSLAAT